jgi:hypothetical protein
LAFWGEQLALKLTMCGTPIGPLEVTITEALAEVPPKLAVTVTGPPADTPVTSAVVPVVTTLATLGSLEDQDRDSLELEPSDHQTVPAIDTLPLTSMESLDGDRWRLSTTRAVTVTEALPETPSAVAVIWVVPAATPWTVPEELTVATPLFPVDQLNDFVRTLLSTA